MKFFTATMGITKAELQMHTSETSSEWRIYETTLREIDRDGLDMSKEWMSTEYQKSLLEMKMTRKRPMGRPRT
jgi:hypothetical protein